MSAPKPVSAAEQKRRGAYATALIRAKTILELENGDPDVIDYLNRQADAIYHTGSLQP